MRHRFIPAACVLLSCSCLPTADAQGGTAVEAISKIGSDVKWFREILGLVADAPVESIPAGRNWNESDAARMRRAQGAFKQVIVLEHERLVAPLDRNTWTFGSNDEAVPRGPKQWEEVFARLKEEWLKEQSKRPVDRRPAETAHGNPACLSNPFFAITGYCGSTLSQTYFLTKELPVDRYQGIADLLDAHDLFTETGVREAVSEVLKRYEVPVAPLALEGESWDRLTALDSFPSIVAVSKKSDTVFMELKASSGAHVAIQIESDRMKPIDLESARSEFRQTALRDIEQYSKGIRLLDLSPGADGSLFVLLAGMSAPERLSANEYADITAGKPLPADHWLTKRLQATIEPIVLYSNAWTQKSGPPLREADALFLSLQRCYPSVAFYRDPLSSSTAARVTEVHQFFISTPDDIAAIVPDRDSGPTDYRVIQNASGPLKQAGVRIRSFKDGALDGPNKNQKAVIVISGHSAAKLQELREQAGGFEGV